jgi:methionyl aminopeptidase
MIHIKSTRELDAMRCSGKLVASVLQKLASMVGPGVSLAELDYESEHMTCELGGKPAFKGYMGYKYSLCTSVNDQVVHGIPMSRRLVEGDIVGLDFGLVYDGYYGDSAVTIPVGKVSPNHAELALCCY